MKPRFHPDPTRSDSLHEYEREVDKYEKSLEGKMEEEKEETRMKLICTGCNKTPAEIEEYSEAAKEENMTPDEYCWEEEGTLNRENGHFLCTTCYINAGMPSMDYRTGGWKAQ